MSTGSHSFERRRHAKKQIVGLYEEKALNELTCTEGIFQVASFKKKYCRK